jgi:hypothetical protein
MRRHGDVVVDNEGSQVETDYICDIPLGTKRLNLGDITRKTDFSDTFFVNFQSPGISLKDAQGNATEADAWWLVKEWLDNALPSGGTVYTGDP